MAWLCFVGARWLRDSPPSLVQLVLPLLCFAVCCVAVFTSHSRDLHDSRPFLLVTLFFGLWVCLLWLALVVTRLWVAKGVHRIIIILASVIGLGNLVFLVWSAVVERISDPAEYGALVSDTILVLVLAYSSLVFLCAAVSGLIRIARPTVSWVVDGFRNPD